MALVRRKFKAKGSRIRGLSFQDEAKLLCETEKNTLEQNLFESKETDRACVGLNTLGAGGHYVTLS